MTKAYGFTLLEVLVALVLLSLLATTSYRALGSVLETEAHARSEQAYWQKLAGSWMRIEDDLANAVAAPVMAPQFGVFITKRTQSGAASFSMGRQMSEDAGGGMLQVHYVFADGELTRTTGQVPAVAGGPLPQVMLSGLVRAEFRYMDGAGRWLPDWNTVSAELPRAVEIVAEWSDGRRLRRVFRTS